MSRLTLCALVSTTIGTVHCYVLQNHNEPVPPNQRTCEEVPRLTLWLLVGTATGTVWCCESYTSISRSSYTSNKTNKRRKCRERHCALLEVLRLALCTAVSYKLIVNPSYTINKDVKKCRDCQCAFWEVLRLALCNAVSLTNLW